MEIEITSISPITGKLLHMFQYISAQSTSSSAAAASPHRATSGSITSLISPTDLHPAGVSRTNETRKKYVLRIKGPNLLIMNGPTKLVEAYKKYYDGYHVLSADGSIEMTVCQSDTCGSKGFVKDEKFFLFGVITNEQDYDDWTWDTPENLAADKIGLCAISGGKTMCDFRTIVNHVNYARYMSLTYPEATQTVPWLEEEIPVPAIVSFDSEALFRNVAARMYGEKLISGETQQKRNR